MKVLALIEGDNEVCCRYRIEGFAEGMAEGEMSLEIVRFRKGILGRIGNLYKAKAADVVILQRKLLPLWQTSLLRHWARRLIFDVDDAVYQRDSNSSKGPESRSRLAKYRGIVAKADMVIAGNDCLKQVTAAWTKNPHPNPLPMGEGICGISPHPSPLPTNLRSVPGEGTFRIGSKAERVCCIPTCIDTRKYRTAVHKRVGAEARLVWIGQQTTLRSLSAAGEQLKAVSERMPDMEFRQICDRSADFPGLSVVLRPWSMESETVELAEGDIGVAWMPDDSWSLGKCGLKVLQYMAAGLPVVANPVGVHREMVIHGETGLLASTPQQWGESVARLAADPQLRNKLGSAGRYLVEKRYSVSAWGAKFAEVVRGE